MWPNCFYYGSDSVWLLCCCGVYYPVMRIYNLFNETLISNNNVDVAKRPNTHMCNGPFICNFQEINSLNIRCMSKRRWRWYGEWSNEELYRNLWPARIWLYPGLLLSQETVQRYVRQCTATCWHVLAFTVDSRTHLYENAVKLYKSGLH